MMEKTILHSHSISVVRHDASIALLSPAKVLNTEKSNSGLMHYKHFTREKQPVTQVWYSMDLDDSLFLRMENNQHNEKKSQ